MELIVLQPCLRGEVSRSLGHQRWQQEWGLPQPAVSTPLPSHPSAHPDLASCCLTMQTSLWASPLSYPRALEPPWYRCHGQARTSLVVSRALTGESGLKRPFSSTRGAHPSNERMMVSAATRANILNFEAGGVETVGARLRTRRRKRGGLFVSTDTAGTQPSPL
jgi:hypothetical protein